MSFQLVINKNDEIFHITFFFLQSLPNLGVMLQMMKNLHIDVDYIDTSFGRLLIAAPHLPMGKKNVHNLIFGKDFIGVIKLKILR